MSHLKRSALVGTAVAMLATSLSLSPSHAAPVQADVVITPNPRQAGAPFEGWGTSLIWMANATGGYPTDLRTDLIDKLFGDDGMRLNIARYNVGGGNATDVPGYLRAGGAVEGWWNPSAPLSDADGPITSKYADRDRYLAAWTGDAAGDYKLDADASQRAWIDEIKDKVTVWEAFSNSPPYFMTESGYTSGGFNSSAEQIKPAATDKFASYLVRAVEALEDAHGIKFDTINPVNEPNTNYWGTQLGTNGWPTGGRQEGAHVGPAAQAGLISALRTELDKAGTTTDAVVSGPDETNPSIFVTDWDGWSAAAKQAVAQLNVHTYGQNDSLRARDIAKASGKPLWMSEVEGNWGGSGFNPTSMANGLGLAEHINKDLRQLEPTAWVFWQPVEDTYNMEKTEKLNWGSVFIDFDCDANGNSARRLADGDADPSCKVLTNTKYDTARNFTHYIRPGDHLIATDNAQTTSAVKADGSGAVAVHTNTATSSRVVQLDLSGFATIAPGATVTPVVTTGGGDQALVTGAPVQINAATGTAQVTVPARSVTTFVIDGVSGVSTKAPGPRDGATVRLVGVKSGKPVQAVGTGTALGDLGDTASEALQQWKFTRIASGEGRNTDRYIIRDAQGKALTTSSNSIVRRDLTDEAAASDTGAQWLLSTTDGVNFSILNAARERVLDVNGESNATGTSIGVWQSSGGTHQLWRLEAVPGTGPRFPDADLSSLVAHDFRLYFANSGAVDTASVDKTDRMGLYQTRTDQAYGPESATGATWGYLSGADSNPARGNTSTSVKRYDTLLVDSEPAGATLDKRNLAYRFDLPNGSYDLSLGFLLPSGWAARTMDVYVEDVRVDSVTASTQATEKTWPVTVTDGALDVRIQSQAGRTNSYLDPAVNSVIVRAKAQWSVAVLREALAQTTLSDGSAWTPASKRAHDAARAKAQALVDATSTDATAIAGAYRTLMDAHAALKPAVAAYTSFTPGKEWLDTDGKVIQAHGGQVWTTKDEQGRSVYYLWGEDRSNGYFGSPGVHAYSSYDLYNWTDQGLALRAMTSSDQLDSDPYFTALYGTYTAEQKQAVFRDLGTTQVSADKLPAILERPKVIYNEATGKWVMWLHADGPSATSSAQYAKANAGVAVADSPFGPFRYIDSYRLHRASATDPTNKAPNNPGMARDMTLFVDDDATGYIVYSSEENQTMFISKLNDDYTGLSASPEDAVEGVDYRRAFIGAARESPAVFKYQGRYFVFTSGTTGWNPNPAKLGTADSMLGQWSDLGDPFPASASSNSFNSQPTNVIPFDAEKGQFIYMGDRWNGGNDLANAQMVWLPVQLKAGGTGASVVPLDEWKLSDLAKYSPFEVKGLPERINVGEQLPAKVSVVANGATTTEAVTWNYAGTPISTPGPVTATGTLASGRSFTHQVLVIPRGAKFIVGAGGQTTSDWSALTQASGPLLNSVADQPFGADPATGTSWGYVGEADSSSSGGTNMFENLRYAKTGKELTYRFEGLKPGTYAVHAGYFDPWSQWATDRGAKVTVNGTVVEQDHRYSSAYQATTYDQVVVGADGVLVFNLAKTHTPDVQLSWLIVTGDDEAAEPLDVAFELTSRCVAGKVYVVATARNNDTVAVDLVIDSAYGKKAVAALQPGKATSASFTTRSASSAAVNATLTVTGERSGSPVTTTVQGSYTAPACG